MQAQSITLDRNEAIGLYRKYRAHRFWSEPLDLEIQRTYELIAKGRVVIKALESITQAGLDADGMPKLAIVRADATKCYVDMWQSGGARMGMDRWPREQANRRYIDFPAGSFNPVNRNRMSGEALAPLIPIDVRPRRGIENYHILFEAVWRPLPPVDPMLVRRIGKADLWVVMAAWELTAVEQAVLAGRL